MRNLAILTAVAMGSLALGSLARPAEAARGEIHILKKKPKAQSERGLIKAARRGEVDRLKEVPADKLEDRYWLAHVVLRFPSVRTRTPYSIQLHRLQGQARKLVDTYEPFDPYPSHRTVLNRVRMDRGRFNPGDRIDMVLVYGGKELAHQRVTLVGEVPKHQNNFDFTKK